MTDLAAQIVAALDRAEETAQAATPGPWEGYDGPAAPPHVRRKWLDDEGRRCQRVVAEMHAEDADAAHIAANDPAHVLRLTTALREVATMCADQLAMNTPPSAVNSEVVWLAEDTLRTLASVWDVPGDNT